MLDEIIQNAPYQNERLHLLYENFLENQENFYLNKLAKSETLKFKPAKELRPNDLVLYHIKSITHKDKVPSKEALENVLNAIKIQGINFIYLLLGDKDGVSFYYGIAKDYSKYDSNNPNIPTSPDATKLTIQEIGENMLMPSIKGNFRGSKIKRVGREEKEQILQKLQGFAHYDILEGVPGVVESKAEQSGEKTFQGMDRLVDAMLSTDDGEDDEKNEEADSNEIHPFGFLVIASPLISKHLHNLEKHIFNIYDELAPFAKKARQLQIINATQKSDSESKSSDTTNTHTKNEGKSTIKTHSESTSESKSTSSSKNTQDGGSSSGTSTSESGSEGSSKDKRDDTQETKQNGKQDSTSQSSSESESKQKSRSASQNEVITLDFEMKSFQSWLKYIDEVILPRLDYGFGRGAFANSILVFSQDKASLRKLENTAISLFSGQNGNKVPLKAFELESDSQQLKSMKNFQLPRFYFENTIQNEQHHAILSQCVSKNSGVLGNWLTAKELSLLVGLPTKEVMGLALKQEVEFGLNFPTGGLSITLGHLMANGHKTSKEVGITKANLDKHIFISGVTGSGKTTTAQRILMESDLPFMVIEPAKTEYRILKTKSEFSDMLIFTLGKDTIAPFRLNPFEFFPHESITSRVDMIKASIEAAFDMEAAIPQLIETMLYRCYEDYGWNIATNKNDRFDNPFADGVYAFPTLSDLVGKIPEVVQEKGFGERLRDEYMGSIRARLDGLLAGAKGFMLNTKRSVDFVDLLEKKVVFELEEIRNGSEKSLVMGFILGNMLEAIKHRFHRDKEHGVKHILLVEEAHRLLSKYQPGDSQNKKQGVEVFADMLAEIRKYGECLIIADQIPNKLTPEVLKNTNTKIIHRLFAADDKESIANTIALEKEQVEFLSKLETGVAVVFSGGFNKAVSVKIAQNVSTTSNEEVPESALQNAIYEYYAKTHKRGIIVGGQTGDFIAPSDIGLLLDIHRENVIDRIVEDFKKFRSLEPNENLRKTLNGFLQKAPMDLLVDVYILNFFEEYADDKRQILKEFLEKYSKNDFKSEDVEKYFNSLKNKTKK